MDGLSRETFFAVAEMVAGHLRLKEADRWSSHVCRLKYHSFTSEFPEVVDAQFMWAAEQWIQGLDDGFHRYPTWRELMAPLYRCEGTLANRSWGPREGLPGFVRFKPEQLALLPEHPRSMLSPPDRHNAGAYDLNQAGRLLPGSLPEESHHGLTDAEWQSYLQRVQEEAPCNS